MNLNFQREQAVFIVEEGLLVSEHEDRQSLHREPNHQKNRLVFIDIETTGLFHMTGDKIVEIACFTFISNEFIPTFHRRINPERFIPYKTTQIHGISNADVVDSPRFADIAQDFLDFVQDAILVGHNIRRFDIPFINSELNAINMASLNNELIDTLEMFRRKHPGLPASLDKVCQLYDINYSERIINGHGALLDAHLARECYKKMI
jgi:DNA polymerase-3 subunit epsilon